MKKNKLTFILLFILFLSSTEVFAFDLGNKKNAPKPSAIVKDQKLEQQKECVLDLQENEKNKITLTPENKYQKDELILKDINLAKTLISEQQKEEMKDIEALWNATIDSNTLIKFTLNKLNSPESQKRLHSSLMAKSLSAMIYGASFIPTFFGADALFQSAAFTSGRLANNYLNKDNVTQNMTLSDTELIQLAGTIEELQDLIISSYYNYKGTLNKLKDTRYSLILYNKNYTNALANEDAVEITISSSQYEDMTLEELRLEEEAKKYYLALERLAGKKAVDSLILSQYALNNSLLNDETFKKE